MLNYVEPLFRPPSEARSLIFQITVGCSQNHCAFCGMYKMKKFRVRPVEEIFAEIESIPRRYWPMIDRVFLADGDGMVYPQAGLVRILDKLAETYPGLTRVASYASPNSLTTKSLEQLRELREKRLKIIYFGLESGDDPTLTAIKKGFSAEEMAVEALKAREAGIKLSVTAILGLAGRERSLEHAVATADWVNRVNPEYFSLLTLFMRHNEDFVRQLKQCSHGEILNEALELARRLNPARTILRSNHVSNFLNLEGSYPKDRERIIAAVEAAIAKGKSIPGFMEEIPDYCEEYY